MTEQTIPLRKDCGGSTITGPDGTEYHWAKDGDVVKVPEGLALALLAIEGGGYSDARGDEPVKATEVTEPAPAPKAAVTEPAPKATVSEPAKKPAPHATSKK